MIKRFYSVYFKSKCLYLLIFSIDFKKSSKVKPTILSKKVKQKEKKYMMQL